MKISIIAAVSDNGVIGAQGKLPWHIPTDLERFKRLTLGNTVIMGRKTMQSLSKGYLPNRKNIVVTSDPSKHHIPDEVELATSLNGAIEKALRSDDGGREIFIIGGQSLFQEGFHLAEQLLITRVHLEIPDGDSFFHEAVEVDPRDWWSVMSHPSKNDIDRVPYTFHWYSRVFQPLTQRA